MAFAPLDLTGRTAVVIGATSDGRVLARGLAEAGADVPPRAARSSSPSSAAEIERAGRRTLRLASDVTDSASLSRRCSTASSPNSARSRSPINCAGALTKRVPTLDPTDADWNGILETNLTGTLKAAQVFGRHMIGRGYGRIKNIASLSSFVAL